MKRMLMGLCVVLALAEGAEACSTFCIRDGALVFGRNYDWSVEDCLVVVNKAGAEKTSMVRQNPVRWTSRYGSVTFNQYGCEFPTGGINEAGLVVEVMWLEGSEYPQPDERPELSTLQWIQYQLDNSTTVSDVIGSDVRVRISPLASAPLHYLVADADGDVASIEFLNGELVVHTGEDLPYAALTNHTYDASARYAAQRDGLGGPRAMEPGGSSLARFARAAARLSAYKADSSEQAVEQAFALLEDVAQGASTVWSIVYDIDARVIHARTHSNPAVKTLALEALNFGCDAPVQVVDLNRARPGNLLGQLTAYTEKANYELMRSSFAQTEFLHSTPKDRIRTLARYPATVTCLPREHSRR